MSYNWFDERAVLREVAEKINISSEDFEMIYQSLISLAMRTSVPDWGYAGMLLSLVNEGIINDVDDLYRRIDLWECNPYTTRRLFQEWNANRLSAASIEEM